LKNPLIILAVYLVDSTQFFLYHYRTSNCKRRLIRLYLKLIERHIFFVFFFFWPARLIRPCSDEHFGAHGRDSWDSKLFYARISGTCGYKLLMGIWAVVSVIAPHEHDGSVDVDDLNQYPHPHPLGSLSGCIPISSHCRCRIEQFFCPNLEGQGGVS